MALTQDDLKRAVAQAAIAYVPNDCIVGVGTGSTANFFIDELAKIKNRIRGAVASSEASTKRLQGHGIEVLSLNEAGELPVYVDGADEITHHMHMLKGGGGALTREKIVAAASKKFICVCDASKLVDVLGKFPLPVEVIPMARSYVARELVKLGGQPQLRRYYSLPDFDGACTVGISQHPRRTSLFPRSFIYNHFEAVAINPHDAEKWRVQFFPHSGALCPPWRASSNVLTLSAAGEYLP